MSGRSYRNKDATARLIFAGDQDGYLMAFDATNGKLIWKASAGGPVTASPIAYAVDGRQYITVAAGGSLFTFGLDRK